MDAIASRTHTTRALINYYFGSKDKLYVAVLEHVYAEIREAEARLEIEHLAPLEAIRRVVAFTYHYYVEHENFVQLVVAENQARGRHLGKSVSMQALNRPIVDRLAGVIERGQRSGIFRPDADPVEVHKAIAALGIFNMTNRHTFGAIFQREMGAKGDVHGRCLVATDIVISYLTNLSQQQP
jgi:AcrR family transcriptional regulator